MKSIPHHHNDYGRFIFISLILLLPIKVILSQSLPQTIQIALELNPNLAAQREALNEAILSAKSTFRATLPKIDLDVSYRHVTETAQIEWPAMGPIPGRTIGLGVNDTYESSLSASYALFTGFAHKNQIKMKNQQVQMNETQLLKTEKQTVFQTIVAYRKVQNYALEIESLQAAKDRLNWQLKRLKSMFEQGMTLALDTLSLSLSRLNYDQTIIAATSQLKTAQEDLTNLVGKNIEVDKIQLQTMNISFPEFDPQMNEDLELINLQKNMLQSGKSLSQASYYPTVALYASFKYGKPGVDFIENDWMTYGVWGVGLNWNLFAWGTDRIKVESQEAALRKVKFQYQSAYNNLQTAYHNALREFSSLKEQFKVSSKALELAESKMKIINSQYRQGMSSVTDFNTANLELTEAEINQKRQFVLILLKTNEIELLSGSPINKWRTE